MLRAVFGSTKVLVPTSTADAPAIRNSKASSILAIPPSPTTGIETTWLTAYTSQTATG